MRPIGGKVSAVMDPKEEEQALCRGSSFFYDFFYSREFDIRYIGYGLSVSFFMLREVIML